MPAASWCTVLPAIDMHRPPASTLIIGYGNPSRGDDALGPAAADALAALAETHPEWGAIETTTDFQLQIEFVMDLAGRERIVFIDAAASGPEPYSFETLRAKQDASVTTHALSPAALLSVFRAFHGHDAPPSFLLGIRGYDFELGKPLTPAAQGNLHGALSMLTGWLETARMA